MRLRIRPLSLGLLGGLLLSSSVSCGPRPVVEKSCGPDSCSGCCTDTGDCLAGTAVFECGAGGAACAACDANQSCQAGVCALFLTGDYDASFPDAPDAQVRLDAGTYVPPADAGTPPRDAGTVDAGPMMVSYARDVQPIFDAKCDACHAWSYDTIVNQNSRIVPSNLSASTIYERTRLQEMPRSGGPLTSTQQRLLGDWILNGAPRN